MTTTITTTRGKNDDTPRIWVGCLASHNAGKLHGAWIDVDQDLEELQAAVQAMLARSPEPGAEEFGIFDYEGFGEYRVDEYEPLENIATLAALIEEHGTVITAFIAHTGCALEDAAEAFQDAYHGAWDSLEDYADQLLEDTGALQGLPENLRGYFDTEAFARDLELSGDVWTHIENGITHVFSGA